MKKLMLALILVSSSAHAEPTVERKIEILLGARHRLPAKADFEASVPEAKAVLMSLAEREELFLVYRHRALEALSMWPGDDVRALYLRVLRSERETAATKQRVLLRVPEVFERDAARVLAPYVDAEDPILRRAAATALETLIWVPGSARPDTP